MSKQKHPAVIELTKNTKLFLPDGYREVKLGKGVSLGPLANAFLTYIVLCEHMGALQTEMFDELVETNTDQVWAVAKSAMYLLTSYGLIIRHPSKARNIRWFATDLGKREWLKAEG